MGGGEESVDEKELGFEGDEIFRGFRVLFGLEGIGEFAVLWLESGEWVGHAGGGDEGVCEGNGEGWGY